ncbi:MAG: hypothetical protein JNL82_04035 [Myxococcales bacterium]|nr:hypothetical protein [Myxococcales bacterium]
MQLCPRCTRHVPIEASGCPCCGQVLRASPAVPAIVLGLVLGVTGIGCDGEGAADLAGPEDGAAGADVAPAAR